MDGLFFLFKVFLIGWKRELLLMAGVILAGYGALSYTRDKQAAEKSLSLLVIVLVVLFTSWLGYAYVKTGGYLFGH